MRADVAPFSWFRIGWRATKRRMSRRPFCLASFAGIRPFPGGCRSRIHIWKTPSLFYASWVRLAGTFVPFLWALDAPFASGWLCAGRPGWLRLARARGRIRDQNAVFGVMRWVFRCRGWVRFAGIRPFLCGHQSPLRTRSGSRRLSPVGFVWSRAIRLWPLGLSKNVWDARAPLNISRWVFRLEERISRRARGERGECLN